MLRVGLTGSIGVGKSFVSSVFSQLGCFVLDADKTAREVVEVGTEGLSAVANAFGDEVIQPDGALNRARLSEIIFADERKRQLLNSILHPFIIAEQDRQLRDWEALSPNGIAIIDAALMIESGGYKRFDKLVVVHCRPEIQIERLMARNGIARDEAETRVRSQMSQEEKKQFGDYLIDSSDGFDDTKRQTAEVHEKLLALVSAKNEKW